MGVAIPIQRVYCVMKPTFKKGNQPSEIYVLISAPGLFSMKIFSLWQQVVDKFNYQKFFILPELHKFADTSK
jgi:flavoprotein